MFFYWSNIDTYEQIGGSAITSYGLEWDDNTSMAEWKELSGYTSDTLQTSFV